MIGASAIEWDKLRAVAREATAHAYVPYSKMTVGASALCSNGIVAVGSNVENASYGLTLCAECSLVSDLIRQGGGRLIAVCVVAGDGEPLTPCGRCRQLLFEHGGNDLLVDIGDELPPLKLRDLLPGAFGPEELGIRRNW